MSLQDLGSLGEFIAAIAVVASLIYVGFQIRQNTRSLKAASYQSVVAAANVDPDGADRTLVAAPDARRPEPRSSGRRERPAAAPRPGRQGTGP